MNEVPAKPLQLPAIFTAIAIAIGSLAIAAVRHQSGSTQHDVPSLTLRILSVSPDAPAGSHQA